VQREVSILMKFALILLGFSCLSVVAMDVPRPSSVPVLVELFTSEGCSSCPPADSLLQKLDAQPVAGVQLIVLSEHVDYWNQIGWKDPYSSGLFSNRQSVYARRFGGSTVYTPQMIVDGTQEFVGSDGHEAQKAIEKARSTEKLPVSISNTSIATSGMLHAHVDIPVLPESLRSKSADVFIVTALNHAESQVLRGENEGRHLSHVAVVQSVTKVGSLNKIKNFTEDLYVKVDPGSQTENLRVVVFVQESGSGRILGAALQQLRN
jgi:hypothetical protein